MKLQIKNHKSQIENPFYIRPMIQFDKFTLDNGLRVIVHKDTSTPMAVVNILYNVGARDENPDQTGFAHLFEHLMFGGSVNIADYDEPLQMAGGENNAYTTNDLTNYYIQVPKENLETAFWLESDRMLSLAFDEKSLEVQRKVVCEEFKEHYIDKPYGDVWFKLRELVYQKHPYRWMTIGKELSHIENAQLQDVKNFFFKHYRPNNAIMVVAGNAETEEVKMLAEKWFGNIPSGENLQHTYPQETEQTEARKLSITADVPLDAFYKCWHIGDRMSKDYHVSDLLTDILGGGESSRLHQKLVKELKLFVNIGCYHLGSIDPGIICIEGKLVKGVKMENAEREVEKVLQYLKEEPILNIELEKVKNKTESMMAFEDMSLLNRANSLAFYELLGDANMMNTEFSKYEAVTVADIKEAAKRIFTDANSNTLYYYAKN